MQTSLTMRLFFLKKISPPTIVATLEVPGVKCVETLPYSIIGHSKKIQPSPNATKKILHYLFLELVLLSLQ